MSPQIRGWVGVIGTLLVVLISVGWWTLQAVKVPPIVAKPPVAATQSPMTGSVIEALKSRTINGDIPVTDPGPSNRSDPFVK